MLLAIDAGNTNIVCGVFADTALRTSFRLSTDLSRTEDEYGVLLRELLQDGDVRAADLNAAVLASVVPPLTEVLCRMCRGRLRLEPLVVGPGIRTGMPILYDNPKEVGADRVVNGVAAYERVRRGTGSSKGVIVVDLGTATTFDVVSPRGEYLGGAIAPGVTISAQALFERAAKLPRVDLAIPASAIGKTTVASMQAGILFGYAALVDGMVARMRAELDFEVVVGATGGLAGLLADCAKSIAWVDENLTLEGLRLIHARNTSGSRS